MKDIAKRHTKIGKVDKVGELNQLLHRDILISRNNRHLAQEITKYIIERGYNIRDVNLDNFDNETLWYIWKHLIKGFPLEFVLNECLSIEEISMITSMYERGIYVDYTVNSYADIYTIFKGVGRYADDVERIKKHLNTGISGRRIYYMLANNIFYNIEGVTDFEYMFLATERKEGNTIEQYNGKTFYEMLNLKRGCIKKKPIKYDIHYEREGLENSYQFTSIMSQQSPNETAVKECISRDLHEVLPDYYTRVYKKYI